MKSLWFQMLSVSALSQVIDTVGIFRFVSSSWNGLSIFWGERDVWREETLSSNPKKVKIFLEIPQLFLSWPSFFFPFFLSLFLKNYFNFNLFFFPLSLPSKKYLLKLYYRKPDLVPTLPLLPHLSAHNERLKFQFWAI